MNKDEMIKGIVEGLNGVPPIFKYPVLVTLCETITEMLPQAKQEYEDEVVATLERFFDLVANIRNE